MYTILYIVIFPRRLSAVKPVVIRESVLDRSLEQESSSSHDSGEEQEEFHGFSESEIDSARSRASSLYSEEMRGRLPNQSSTKYCVFYLQSKFPFFMARFLRNGWWYWYIFDCMIPIVLFAKNIQFL